MPRRLASTILRFVLLSTKYPRYQADVSCYWLRETGFTPRIGETLPAAPARILRLEMGAQSVFVRQLRSALDVFDEARFDQLSQRSQRFVGVRARGTDRKLGTLPGREGENREDALAVDKLVVFRNLYVRLETLGQPHEQVGGPGMQSLRIYNGHTFLNKRCVHTDNRSNPNGCAKIELRNEFAVVGFFQQLGNLLGGLRLLQKLEKYLVAKLTRDVLQRAKVVAWAIRRRN